MSPQMFSVYTYFPVLIIARFLSFDSVNIILREYLKISRTHPDIIHLFLLDFDSGHNATAVVFPPPIITSFLLDFKLFSAIHKILNETRTLPVMKSIDTAVIQLLSLNKSTEIGEAKGRNGLANLQCFQYGGRLTDDVT